MKEFDHLRKAVEAGDDVIPVPIAQLEELLSRIGLIERAEDALHELLSELDDARSSETHEIEDDRCDYNFHVTLAEFRDDNGECCHCGEAAEHQNHLAVYVCVADDNNAGALETMQERAKRALAQRAQYEARKAARELEKKSLP